MSRNREDIADRAKVLRWLRDRGLSLPQIAAITGLRSHTTVMYALQRAEGRKAREGRVKIKVRIIPRSERMRIATQRKLAAIKAEERQKAQKPADDAPGSISSPSSAIGTKNTPQPEPSTASRCPACGCSRAARAGRRSGAPGVGRGGAGRVPECRC